MMDKEEVSLQSKAELPQAFVKGWSPTNRLKARSTWMTGYSVTSHDAIKW
jgi:hypothetical protein